jgi:glycine/D-amino acid oxidase-like deaminating enzyme
MKTRDLAILGAGIMGCSLALYAARRGMNVQLYDAGVEPFCGASRWNEGKIHLGYLYGADHSMATARRLLPGGLAFCPLVSELIGRDVRSYATDHDDLYLVHRDSVASPAEVLGQARRVAELADQHPDANDYFVPLRKTGPRPLSRAELQEFGPEIQSGFRVPERSVPTRQLADDFVESIRAEPRITLNMERWVRAVKPGRNGWSVVTGRQGQDTVEGPFDSVANCLWEGRGLVDETVGVRRSPSWTHRYRVSLFASTSRKVQTGSAVIAVGPFGDIKNYDGRSLYLSWYPAGLLAEGTDLAPPPAPVLTEEVCQRVERKTLAELARVIPAVADLPIQSVQVQGGWVYATGTGSLSEPDSGLHRRSDIGITGKDGYYSVDTGKYSTAPWLARQLSEVL